MSEVELLFNIVKNIVGEGMLSLPAGIAGGTGTQHLIGRRLVSFPMQTLPEVSLPEPRAPFYRFCACGGNPVTPRLGVSLLLRSAY